jgi:hypothetical protein
MTNREPFLAPRLRTWMVRMIEDNNQQFLGGDVRVVALSEPSHVRCWQSLARDVRVVVLSEPRHVRCGQSLASGRGCVKQRQNQPNSAAQTIVLSHMI